MLTTATAIAVLAGADAGAAAGPAHGRAWELVTPPDPLGAAVSNVYGIGPAGDRLTFDTVGPLPGSQAGSLLTPSLARRTSLGWESHQIMPRYSVPSFGTPLTVVAANADMSTWIWASKVALTPDGPTPPNLGLYRSGLDATPALLVDAGFNDFSTPYKFAGASADTRHVFFQAVSALLPEDVRTSGMQLYEISDAGLRLVGVDSGGAPLSACGAIAGSSGNAPSPISRDGRRAFVTSPDAACGAARKRVYLREDGTTTTEVSASRCTRVSPPCNAASDVRFMGANPSGSVAFVATAQQLTDDDLDSGQDLYRYDVAGGTLTRVSVGQPGVAANVAPTAAAYPSGDGSRVYFVASGQLVPGKGTPGSPNVYVADGAGLRFVATIAASDSWLADSTLLSGDENVQPTPDGERLVIVTAAPLTADDTDTSKDVYLYDAEADALSRLSGAAGSGNGAFDADLARTGFNPVPAFPTYLVNSISDDGRHVFFKTDEPLTAGDANATVDVYEWEDGDLGLVTSGAQSGSLRYLSASADGSSVFFTTDESLTWDDDDRGDPDLYVARKGGGFPPREVPPEVCAGGACSTPQPPVRVERPVPASVGFVDRMALRGRFDVLPVSAGARRRMAASGWLRLGVETAAPGRVTARALARVGGRRRTVASGEGGPARGGTVRLRLRLSPAARRRLADGHALVVRVVLRRSRPDRSASVRLKLERSR